MTGGCTTCGRNFKRHDFRCDEIGRAILVHRCRAEDIAAFRARAQLEQIDPTVLDTKFCRRCEQAFQPRSIVQVRCTPCIPIYNRDRDRRMKAKQRGAA